MLKRFTVITFRYDYTKQTINQLCRDLAEALGFFPNINRRGRLPHHMNLSITIDVDDKDVLVVQEYKNSIQELIDDVGEGEVDHIHCLTMTQFRLRLGLRQENITMNSDRTFDKEDYYAS